MGGFAQSPPHFLAAKPRLRETRPLVCEYKARPSLGSFGRHRKHAEPGNFLSKELQVYTIGAHFPLLAFVRAASSDIGCIRLSGIAISSRYATQLKQGLQGLLQLQSHPNRLRWLGLPVYSSLCEASPVRDQYRVSQVSPSSAHIHTCACTYMRMYACIRVRSCICGLIRNRYF